MSIDKLKRRLSADPYDGNAAHALNAALMREERWAELVFVPKEPFARRKLAALFAAKALKAWLKDQSAHSDLWDRGVRFTLRTTNSRRLRISAHHGVIKLSSSVYKFGSKEKFLKDASRLWMKAWDEFDKGIEGAKSWRVRELGRDYRPRRFEVRS